MHDINYLQALYPRCWQAGRECLLSAGCTVVEPTIPYKPNPLWDSRLRNAEILLYRLRRMRLRNLPALHANVLRDMIAETFSYPSEDAESYTLDEYVVNGEHSIIEYLCQVVFGEEYGPQLDHVLNELFDGCLHGAYICRHYNSRELAWMEKNPGVSLDVFWSEGGNDE